MNKTTFDSTDLYWVFAVCSAGTALGPGNVLVNEKDKDPVLIMELTFQSMEQVSFMAC